MDIHKNARLTPKGREAMVRFVMEGGLSKAAAARQFNTTPSSYPGCAWRRLRRHWHHLATDGEGALVISVKW